MNAIANTSVPSVPSVPYTEAEIRAMRDQVYGIASSDNNWNGCREQWMTLENIEWLKGQIILQQHRGFIFAKTPSSPGSKSPILHF